MTKIYDKQIYAKDVIDNGYFILMVQYPNSINPTSVGVNGQVRIDITNYKRNYSFFGVSADNRYILLNSMADLAAIKLSSDIKFIQINAIQHTGIHFTIFER